MTQKIVYNETGQSVVFDCPEGRPSSITSVTVFPRETGDDGTAESALDAAAIETNPDTTFDANSGDGETDPTLMNLAATTGIAVGRNYLITSVLAGKEFVEIDAIAAGVSANARYNLRNTYANADTFESTRISAVVNATWVADEQNISDDLNPNSGYRIRWEYIVDSLTIVRDDYFNLVRYKANHSVTAIDISKVRTGWLTELAVEHAEDRGASLIDDAYTEMSFDLHRIGIPSEMLRNRDVVNRLVIHKAILMTEYDKAIRTQSTIGYDLARDVYNGIMDGLIRVTNRTDMSTDAEGAGTSVNAISIMER